MHRLLVLALGIVFSLGLFAGHATAKEFLIGLQTDRSGAVQNVGNPFGDGFHDYVKLYNSRNGLGGGHKVKVMEIDHGYTVPRGIEAYERHKAAGALTISIFGTPQTVALAPKLLQDKTLGTSPGFGSAMAANGKKFPYLFPIAASYWSQAGAGMKFILDEWKKEGKSGKPKIAFIYGDNPAGREPIAMLKDIAKLEGITMQNYAVPPPYIEFRPQVIAITRKFKADWILSHLFGRAPAISIREFKRMGIARTRMLGFIWSGGEADFKVAGWDSSEGYYVMQIAHVGKTGNKILDDIRALYAKDGKSEPKMMSVSVFYNRGIMTAAIHSEAIRLAIAKKGPNIGTDDVKMAMETIKNFSLGGFMPPMTITQEDHEGGGFVRVFQVHDGGFRPVTGWYQGYRSLVRKRLGL